MELWDLYTENRELTGRDHIRGQAIPENCYHLVVHVWIRNSQGQYLISQRAASRPTCPLLWECVGGSVLKGETSLQGALREVREEVGIDLKEPGRVLFSKVRKSVDRKRFNDILDVWLFESDADADLAHADTDEVAQSKWMTREQIRQLYDSGQLVSTLAYFFDRHDL